MTRPLALAWYCPSEGDGSCLGTAPPRASRPTIALPRARSPARPSAPAPREILVPTGTVNDSFAPDAPFMESWTTASALAPLTRAHPPAGGGQPRRRCGPSSPPTRPRRSGADGARADRHQPRRRRRPGHRLRRARRSTTPAATRASAALADAAARALRRARSTWAAPARPAMALAARVADTYLMWGEPPEAIAARIAAMRAARAGRPMRFGLRIHLIARRHRRRGPRRRAPSCSRAPRSPATGRPSTRPSTAWARRG